MPPQSQRVNVYVLKPEIRSTLPEGGYPVWKGDLDLSLRAVLNTARGREKSDKLVVFSNKTSLGGDLLLCTLSSSHQAVKQSNTPIFWGQIDRIQGVPKKGGLANVVVFFLLCI